MRCRTAAEPPQDRRRTALRVYVYINETWAPVELLRYGGCDDTARHGGGGGKMGNL